MPVLVAAFVLSVGVALRVRSRHKGLIQVARECLGCLELSGASGMSASKSAHTPRAEAVPPPMLPPSATPCHPPTVNTSQSQFTNPLQ